MLSLTQFRNQRWNWPCLNNTNPDRPAMAGVLPNPRVIVSPEIASGGSSVASRASQFTGSAGRIFSAVGNEIRCATSTIATDRRLDAGCVPPATSHSTEWFGRGKRRGKNWSGLDSSDRSRSTRPLLHYERRRNPTRPRTTTVGPRIVRCRGGDFINIERESWIFNGYGI